MWLVDDVLTFWTDVWVLQVLDDAWLAEGVKALRDSGRVHQVTMTDLASDMVISNSQYQAYTHFLYERTALKLD